MNTSGKLLTLNSNSEEFAAVLNLDQQYFPMPWSELDWDSLNWNHHQLFGIKDKIELIGFALFNHVPGDDTVHLLKICLKPGERGGPVSGAFWSSIIQVLKQQGLKSIYLEVESQNLRAIGFYRKTGFTLLRTIKGYYSNGDDAHTMQLTL